MRLWVWIFIVILTSGLVTATRFHANLEYEHLRSAHKIHPIYEQIIKDAGAYNIVAIKQNEMTESRSTRFHLAGCADPYTVYELPIGISLPIEFQRDQLNRLHMRVLYFDSVTSEWSRIKNTLRFIKVTFASVFSLTRFSPSQKLLILLVPDTCNNLDAVDWSKVWHKDL